MLNPFGLSLSKPCPFALCQREKQPFDKLRVSGKRNGRALFHPIQPEIVIDATIFIPFGINLHMQEEPDVAAEGF